MQHGIVLSANNTLPSFIMLSGNFSLLQVDFGCSDARHSLKMMKKCRLLAQQ